ncbi:MAG TPA: WD40 repeat domain-containing protein, partial [Gemmataceae bacterium]|nr:WD40 repeat domain-containing protein [Gemmataceae bacterium]
MASCDRLCRPSRPGAWLRALLALGVAVAAAAWSARGADGPEIDRLVRQLGSDTFARREEATKRLREIGGPALEALRKAAASEDFEVRRRARELVAAVEKELYGEKLCLTGHTNEVISVAASPDGRLALSGSNDGTIRLWDLQAGKELRQLPGHKGQAWAVAFSPDGKRALGGGQDRGLVLWEVATGKELRRFPEHPQAVRAVAFTPDGKRAMTACYDRVLRLWDVEAGKEIRSFTGHGDSIMCLAV